jgi:osmotically-inducible protein OsmY
MPRSVVLALLATLAVVASGCSLSGPPARRFVDDATISSRVRARLARAFPSLATIGVDTFEGTVYLNGPVDTDEEKRVAGELARDVDDVELVVSNLHVTRPTSGTGALPAAAASEPPARTDSLPAVVPDAPYTGRQ